MMAVYCYELVHLSGWLDIEFLWNFENSSLLGYATMLVGNAVQRVISVYCLTWHHFAEDLNLYQLWCESLKFRIMEVFIVYTSHLGVLCTFIKLLKQSLKILFLCACVLVWCRWKWCKCFVASDQVRLVSAAVFHPSAYQFCQTTVHQSHTSLCCNGCLSAVGTCTSDHTSQTG